MEERKSVIMTDESDVSIIDGVGDTGSITKKEATRLRLLLEAKGKLRKIQVVQADQMKPKSSIKTPPRNTSPPKTRVGGSGKITKRR